MRRFVWLTLGVAAWLTCSVFAYGLSLAYFQRAYPRQALEGCGSDRVSAGVAALTGPMGLIVAVVWGPAISIHGAQGLLFHCLTPAEVAALVPPAPGAHLSLGGPWMVEDPLGSGPSVPWHAWAPRCPPGYRTRPRHDDAQWCCWEGVPLEDCADRLPACGTPPPAAVAFEIVEREGLLDGAALCPPGEVEITTTPAGQWTCQYVLPLDDCADRLPACVARFAP